MHFRVSRSGSSRGSMKLARTGPGGGGGHRRGRRSARAFCWDGSPALARALARRSVTRGRPGVLLTRTNGRIRDPDTWTGVGATEPEATRERLGPPNHVQPPPNRLSSRTSSAGRNEAPGNTSLEFARLFRWEERPADAGRTPGGRRAVGGWGGSSSSARSPRPSRLLPEAIPRSDGCHLPPGCVAISRLIALRSPAVHRLG
jgi:hypothetical protein